MKVFLWPFMKIPMTYTENQNSMESFIETSKHILKILVFMRVFLSTKDIGRTENISLIFDTHA